MQKSRPEGESLQLRKGKDCDKQTDRETITSVSMLTVRLSNRLLKNGHQSRATRDFPHPSPCQARGRFVAAYSEVRLTPQDCLPDRQVKSTAGALHLALFEQPGKDDFFSSLIIRDPKQIQNSNFKILNFLFGTFIIPLGEWEKNPRL